MRVAALLPAAAAAAAAPNATAAARASIKSQEVKVPGLKCGGGPKTAMLYYPTSTAEKYPLLAFAHGWTEGGANVKRNYKDVLETVAAAGYVVIALESCVSKLDDQTEKADQLRTLAYVKDTPQYASRVDTSSKAGVYGHSMGGAASCMNAGDSAAVKKYNLGAAFCLHPEEQLRKTLVPTFFASGSADTIVPPATVKAQYSKASSPKVFAEIKGATHFECQSFEAGVCTGCKHRWTPYVVHWMDCHIKRKQQACTKAFGVCDGPIKMTQCVKQGGAPPPAPPRPPAPAPTPPAPAPAPPAPAPPAPTPPAPATKYSCQGGACVPDAGGLDRALCLAACG